MYSILLVGIGGFFGSILRYGVSLLLQAKPYSGFPFATLIVNLLGAFAIGVLLSFDKKILSNTMYLFLITGLLGGFTTYSAFSAEMVMLFRNNELGYAAAYFLITVFGGFVLTVLGFYLSQHIIKF